MARPVHIPRRTSRHAQQLEEIEMLRYQLPVNLYVEVLHRAATHGELLTYNPDGTIRSARQCSPKEQLECARYLVDKVMSSRSPSPAPADTSDFDDESLVRNLQHLPTDQLRRLIHADSSVNPSHP